jgi:hypothetical protein
MSFDTRGIVSWGMYPDVVVTTKAPFAASWGYMSKLHAAVARIIHHLPWMENLWRGRW